MRNVEPSPAGPVARWRPLLICNDAERARMIATCIAAMEYEVHLVGGDERGTRRFGDRRVEVRVPEDDWAVLAEVLDEIIAEQEQFDACLDAGLRGSRRTERRLLYAMIVIVGALAAAGLVEV